MDYLDFELEIDTGSGREYPVRVINSPAGEAREIMYFPFGELEIENKLQALQIALLRSGGKRREMLSPEQRTVQDFGRTLFNALLTGEVRVRYDVSLRDATLQGRGLRLKLRVNAPEMATLPWEFLYDPRRAEYVCLSQETPVVRYLELPQPIQPLAVTPPLRVLGMVASPSDVGALNVDVEKQRVETALRDLKAAGLVELTWLEGQTWRALQQAMRRGEWHVFHFIGHGDFDAMADEGLLLFCDDDGRAEKMHAAQLARLLANAPGHSLRLALLNACESGRGSARDLFSSTASILVRRGIPAVLAMQYAITDRAAIEFARTFYESLVDGFPVDAAVVESRVAISLAVHNTVEWGTPVLYMRSPDGRLFRMQEAGSKMQEEDVAAISKSRSDVSHQPSAVSPKRPAASDQPPVVRAEHPASSFQQPASSIQQPASSSQQRSPLIPQPQTHPPQLTTPNSQPSPLPFKPEMILIPAGEFLMGSDPQKDKDAQDEEQPQHTLYLPEYWIAKTPVTNVQYAAFVQATGYEAPKHWWKKGKIPQGKDMHPVVEVTWYDALAFCTWLAEVTGKPYTLPSEAEWEKAARGTDGRIYPWGNTFDQSKCNTSESRIKDTTPVDKYPQGASPYGVLDMAGNVAEWTRSLWGWLDGRDFVHAEFQFRYPYQVDDEREDLKADDEWPRVLRGGSFNGYRDYARCAIRDCYFPFTWVAPRGFRVVVSPSRV